MVKISKIPSAFIVKRDNEHYRTMDRKDTAKASGTMAEQCYLQDLPRTLVMIFGKVAQHK